MSDTSSSSSIPTEIVTANVLPSALSATIEAPTTTTAISTVTLAGSRTSSTAATTTIQPDGGTPSQPNNSTLIQLGFDADLKYDFVSSSTITQQQIFQYLPVGVANGLNMSTSEVLMQYLQPYDTLSAYGYISTLAMAYIPSTQVDVLSLLLLNTNSNLYHGDKAIVDQLMGMLNAEIPLLAGQALPPQTSSSIAPEATSQTSTPNSSATSAGAGAGIGMAILLAIIALGIGVLFLLRRRRRRRDLAAVVYQDKAQLDDTSKAKLWHELSPDQMVHEATVESQRNELSASKQISEMPAARSIYEMDPGDDGMPPEMPAGPLSQHGVPKAPMMTSWFMS